MVVISETFTESGRRERKRFRKSCQGSRSNPPLGANAHVGRLNGKVAIVTGAGGGIGRAMAARLADEGAKVVAADLNEEAVAATGEHPGVDFEVVDVSEPKDVERLVATTVERHGTLTTMCNNAAISIPGDVTDVSVEDLDRTIAAYCASKGGVLMLTKAVALDYADKTSAATASAPGAWTRRSPARRADGRATECSRVCPSGSRSAGRATRRRSRRRPSTSPRTSRRSRRGAPS
jgi:NAD(P)-dependent dehydrogenase (short-subunit alcohol dehydrogenase family)